MKAIIFGAGLAGLKLAYNLLKKGVEVEILEKSDKIGGLMQTFMEDGFYIDYGPHIFFEHNLPQLKELLQEDIMPVNVAYGVGFKKKIVSLPLNPIEFSLNLPLPSFLLLGDLIIQKCRQKNVAPETAAQWCVNQFGRIAYRYFFKDYIPKVMLYPPTQISSDWGKERGRFYQEHNVDKKALIKKFFKFKQKRRFYYPLKGAYQIISALADFIQQNKGIIHLNCQLSKIEVKNNQVTSVKGVIGGNDITIKGDVYISTIPITNLISLVHPAYPKKLSYSSLWLFYLIINRDYLTQKVQIYFPEKKYIFKRIYEPKNLNPRMGKKGKTALCVEVCYGENSSVSQIGETELLNLIIKGLNDFFGIKRQEISKSWSIKLPYAYAIYKKGYREILKDYARLLFRINNLISFGRQGSFRYNFLADRVMEAADAVTDFILAKEEKKNYLKMPMPKSIFF
jgi:protoporphyrinogen oxidase